MQSVFGKVDANTLAERGTPDYTGVSLHTSAQAIPIPILWGTRRISPNVIWQSQRDMSLDKSTTIVENINGTRPFQGQVSPNTGPPWTALDIFSTGGFWGQLTYAGSPGVNPAGFSTIHYWVPTILALCEGPISDPSSGNMRVWRGGGTAPVLWAGLDTGKSDEQPFLESILGTSSQALWSYWTSSPGAGISAGQALAYRFTAYIASAFLNTGNNNVIPQWSFEISRILHTTPQSAPDSYSLGIDYALTSVITDLLESSQYGNGFTSGDIDSASLAQCAAYQYAQGLYFSPLLTSQTSVVDLINRWAILMNSWVFWSGVAMYFVPLGDETIGGYTPDVAVAYDLGFGDFLTPLTVERADPIDCFNRVRLEFKDRAIDYATNPIEWKDSTLINQYGILDASNIDGQDCCDVVVAAKIVELVGKRLAYVRNRYTFTLSYRYIRLLPGSIVTLNDANLGLSALPVRVVSVDENEKGELAIVAEEYPGTLGISRPVANQTWSNTGTGGTLTGGSPGGSTSGGPTSTVGGTLVMTTAMQLILYVAGDIVTLPLTMTVGVPYVAKHDQLRSPQPTPPILEDNPVTFQRPGGATYNIEDPSDGTLAPAASVKLRTSAANFALVNTGDGIIRYVIG